MSSDLLWSLRVLSRSPQVPFWPFPTSTPTTARQSPSWSSPSWPHASRWCRPWEARCACYTRSPSCPRATR